MQVKTECQVCESALARYTCFICGRNVCGQHYNRAKEICIDCSKRKVK